MADAHQTPDNLADKLEAYLRQQTSQDVTIQSVKLLAGGASRESWKVVALFDGVPQQLVVRKDLPTTMNESALTRGQEFHLMKRAYEHGVKVAPVRWLCEDPSVLGLPFFIMDFVEGISIGRKVMTQPELAKAREHLPGQMAEQLARIHTLDITHSPDFAFLQRPVDQTPAQWTLQSTYNMLDDLQINNPALEFALRWCALHLPESQRVTFVHGDFRIGNLLIDESGLAAVIDWEFAHIGDPAEEIGYLCMRDWRFGGTGRAAGLTDRDEFLRVYAQHSGVTIEPSAADWWEIMGNIRWAAICISQAHRHLSGEETSVEFASLGRRSSEMQLEALRLIEKIGIALHQG